MTKMPLFPNTKYSTDFQYLLDLGTLLLHVSDSTVDEHTIKLQEARERVKKYLAAHRIYHADAGRPTSAKIEKVGSAGNS